MSDCRVPMTQGEVIAKLNERNRRLCNLVREMWSCLSMAPSSWEDDEHHAKRFWDGMHELGIAPRKSNV